MIIIIDDNELMFYPRAIRIASVFLTLFILQIVMEGKGNSLRETGSGLKEIMMGDPFHF